MTDPGAPVVLVVGDLLYDLISTVDEIAFGTDTFARIEAAPGGSGANAAAWLASEGLVVHFVGRVGDDVLGRFLAADLEAAGVKPHLAVDPELPTGKVFILVDGTGERTMITDRGASEALHPEDLKRFPFTHLHLPAYTLSTTSRRETATKALAMASENGATVSADPSATPLIMTLTPACFLEWTAGSDLLFPNLEEGAMLARTEDPERIARTLLDHYGAVILKLGPEGVLYADRGGKSLHLPASTLPAAVDGGVLPVPPNSTGGGDALCAGFLAGWLRGAPPEDALRRGLDLAARTIAQPGARPRR
jgi:sugar/nucleoside kinase (ribokinase family)